MAISVPCVVVVCSPFTHRKTHKSIPLVAHANTHPHRQPCQSQSPPPLDSPPRSRCASPSILVASNRICSYFIFYPCCVARPPHAPLLPQRVSSHHPVVHCATKTNRHHFIHVPKIAPPTDRSFNHNAHQTKHACHHRVRTTQTHCSCVCVLRTETGNIGVWVRACVVVCVCVCVFGLLLVLGGNTAIAKVQNRERASARRESRSDARRLQTDDVRPTSAEQQ